MPARQIGRRQRRPYVTSGCAVSSGRVKADGTRWGGRRERERKGTGLYLSARRPEEETLQFDTDHFDPEAYLARLAIDAPKPGADGLAALQEAQLSAIAFENLDPLTGRVPDLDPQALADKLLARRRGGYCFELNSLFGRALSAFGFKARA